ncbi:MAG: flagellin [Velocimicrobium sp.]
MSVSGISSTNDAYTKLSSMKNINSAKDNAAGAAIVEGMKAQATENNVLADGAESKQDMLSVTDGGLQSISDSLQRMRELSIQAGNATNTDSDKATIQEEIEQLKQGISSTAGNTEFNTKKLLDGNSDSNATLGALGISDYDVTSGDYDVSVIDDAIKTINSKRSSVGATSNALDSTVAYNKLSNENLTSSFSKMEDLDVEKAVSDQKKEEILNEYKTFAQKMEQNQVQGTLNLLNM